MLKSKDITLLTKVSVVKAMVFPVVMYEYKSWSIMRVEGRRIDAFELWHWRRLLSPLNSKEIKLVNHKENQYWVFIRRTDAEAETLILWPLNMKNWLFGKDPDARKDWRQEEKGMTEVKMIGWDHQILDMSLSKLWELVMDREDLACYSPWDSKDLVRIEWLNLNIKD